MRYSYLHIFTLLTLLTCQSALAKCRRNSRNIPAMAALQRILTGNKMPAQLRNRRLPVETIVPGNAIVPLPYARSEKCPCQSENYQRIIPEMIMQELVRIPEKCPCQMDIPRVLPEIRMPEMRTVEMPRQYIASVPMNPVVAAPTVEILNPPMVIQNMPEIRMPNVLERFESPCASPRALVNPFLPAASPVSALAPPNSNLLPPVSFQQSRSNFLRKIPIPPPTL